MDVSLNDGTPKSSILIGFSIINHAFWGTPIFGNTRMGLILKGPPSPRVPTIFPIPSCQPSIFRMAVKRHGQLSPFSVLLEDLPTTSQLQHQWDFPSRNFLASNSRSLMPLKTAWHGRTVSWRKGRRLQFFEGEGVSSGG